MTSQKDLDDYQESDESKFSLLPDEVPSTWRSVTLGDVIERISNRVNPQEFPDENYISLKHLDKSSPRAHRHGLAEEVTSKKYRFEEGDILFGKLRPYFRKVVLAEFDGVCSTDINVIKPKEGIDRNFLHYTLFRQDLIAIADKTSTGTRMPRADWDVLNDVEIALPPIEEQKRIAKALHDLDSKISVNKDIIDLCDQYGQLLFQMHFEEFEPYDEIRDSAVGNIPNQFEVAELGDVCQFEYGEQLTEDDREGDKYPVYGSNGITGRHNESLIEGPGIIVGRKGVNFGSVNLEMSDFWPIDTTFYIQPKNPDEIFYVYHLLKTVPFDHLGSDSAVPGLNRNVAEDQEIILPPRKDRRDFNDLVQPFHQKAYQCRKENEDLNSLRDALLPKILNGKVRFGG